jgi:hypothetical protein
MFDKLPPPPPPQGAYSRHSRWMLTTIAPSSSHNVATQGRDSSPAFFFLHAHPVLCTWVHVARRMPALHRLRWTGHHLKSPAPRAA